MIINNIVYHENFSYSSIIKDYLISDDLSEFLKLRLPKFYEYYETYSRIYPNYTSLPEAKFIYKNIHKKQKMIDLQQAIEDSQEIKKNFLIIIIILKKIIFDNNKYEVVFSTDVYNSIVNVREDLYNLLFGIEKNNYILEQKIKECNKLINEIEK